jgi:perosamine synthetase
MHEWFTPQHVGSEYVNSFWTWVCRNRHASATWHEIRDAFLAEGGDGVYAAWKLTYLEPMFIHRNLLRRERYISPSNLESYRLGLCPIAERLQPQLFQFKTNYWDLAQAYRQADILRRVLLRFN